MFDLFLFYESMKKTFNIKDSATRTEFWNFHTISTLINIFILFYMFEFSIDKFNLAMINPTQYQNESNLNSFSSIIIILYFLFISINNITIGMRRLNDIKIHKILIFLIFTPLIGFVLYFIIGFIPSKKDKESVILNNEKNKLKNDNFI